MPPQFIPTFLPFTVVEDRTITVTGTVTVDSFETETVRLTVPQQGPSPFLPAGWIQTGYNTSITVVSANWTSIEVDNPEIQSALTDSGLATFAHQDVDLEVGDGIVYGASLRSESGNFYSMDRHGVIDPIPEVGLVSREEGIKLLCDLNGRPFGFPTSLPIDAGANEAQYHYSMLKLESQSDNSVAIGFFDRAEQEFVTSITGEPEIPYLEYIRRGPHNIFIAVTSDFEQVEEKVLTAANEDLLVPHKWAMPVYGAVFKEIESRISLTHLPDALDHTDIWPIAVRNGKFDRELTIRPKEDGPLTGYLSQHQGQKVTAYYGLPEAELLTPYSEEYGWPYIDVKEEFPTILNDDHIKVRQAPIASFKISTEFPTDADPVRPVFVVYTRTSLSSLNWIPIPRSEIRDYNTSTGEIYLSKKLRSTDPRLICVDYVTTSPTYNLKRFDQQLLNLNARSDYAEELFGKSIYVYIVPHYIRNSNDQVVSDSFTTNVLRTSFTNDVFDPLSSFYDPTALLIGVVYISIALDVDNVTMFDTRRRGGGLDQNVDLDEIQRLVQEVSSYWDVGYSGGMSYQKSGFVIVRLPVELSEYFTENEIMEVVQRNMTAGVAFKIEDLQGNEWPNEPLPI